MGGPARYSRADLIELLVKCKMGLLTRKEMTFAIARITAGDIEDAFSNVLKEDAALMLKYDVPAAACMYSKDQDEAEVAFVMVCGKGPVRKLTDFLKSFADDGTNTHIQLDGSDPDPKGEST